MAESQSTNTLGIMFTNSNNDTTANPSTSVPSTDGGATDFKEEETENVLPPVPTRVPTAPPAPKSSAPVETEETDPELVVEAPAKVPTQVPTGEPVQHVDDTEYYDVDTLRDDVSTSDPEFSDDTPSEPTKWFKFTKYSDRTVLGGGVAVVSLLALGLFAWSKRK